MKSGHDVAVFHRGTKETTLPGSVRHLHGDRERLAHFQDEFREFAPDCVVAMALPAGNDQTGRLFVDVFRRIARRAVVITSRDVYRAFGRLSRLETGTPDPVPLTETSPLREKFYPYRGKAVDPMWTDSDDLLVERAVMNEPHFQATVIRLPVIYGPQDEYFHRTFPYLKRMDDGRRAILLDEAHADWKDSRVYVEDAAWAIVLAATDDRAGGHIYNVAPTRTLTEAEWVESIGNVAGWSGDVVRIPRDRLPKHLVRDLDFRHDLALSSQRIRDELGYSERISFDRGLRETIEWERSNAPEIQRDLFDYEAEDIALRGTAL